jgi:eukaryotic-like serine/threonine-protein kinase
MQNTRPVGTIIRNQYLVQELLSKGTFSAIYLVGSIRLVEEPRGKRFVATRFALKEVIIPNRQLRHQINFEAIPLRGIDHEAFPHIYEVFNINIHNRLYILMDYIEGPNLENMRSQQPDKRLPLSQAMVLMAPIIDAVSYLHRQQPPIIHQNIEPTSIVLSKANNRAVLVDFGVGKNYNLSSLDVPVHCSVIGYEAPEQFSGEEVDIRTDIYGLGATFYTLLTGSIPPDALQRKRLIESENVDPLEPVDRVVPTIPAHVAGAIRQAMSLSIYDRFLTVEQFVQALKAEPAQQPSETITVHSAAQDREVSPPDVAPLIQEDQSKNVPVNLQSSSHPSFVPPSKTVETLPPIPVTEPPRVHTSKKPAALLPILLALIVSVGVSAGLLLYITGDSSLKRITATTAVLHKTALHSTSVPTETPTSSSIITLAESYKGSIYDLPLSMTTALSLTQVQQNQGNISGYFTGLHMNGPFKSVINDRIKIMKLVRSLYS